MINSRFIEITGPTGVGKSTVSDILRNKADKPQKWIFSEDLTKIIKPGGVLFPHLDVFAGLRFHKSHPQYKKLFQEIHAHNIKSDSWYIRNKRALQHYKVICDVQMVEEFLTQRKNSFSICVFEEGLVFKSFSRIDITQLDGQLDIYSNSFPLPKTIIHLEADAKEIAHRAFEREKTAPVHLNKSYDEILDDIVLQKNRAKNLNEFLTQIGVKVRVIDADSKPEMTAQKVSAVLDELAY